ncbi:MAG: LapA family protein [Desulfobacteraceae bacterium]|nr:MAG: LapA family protein [Desulfobacteraceae bacterium]
MKKLKVVLWLIIIGSVGMVMYQNRDFFLARQSLGIDLISTQYQSPALPNAILFIAFFLFGWLIAYLFSLAERFKAGKTIKRLQHTVRSQQNDIDIMKKDVAALKPQIGAAGAKPPAQTQTDADTASP